MLTIPLMCLSMLVLAGMSCVGAYLYFVTRLNPSTAKVAMFVWAAAFYVIAWNILLFITLLLILDSQMDSIRTLIKVLLVG